MSLGSFARLAWAAHRPLTCATAGAVLLVMAIGYERRSRQVGVAASLRDLT